MPAVKQLSDGWNPRPAKGRMDTPDPAPSIFGLLDLMLATAQVVEEWRVEEPGWRAAPFGG